MLAVLSDFRAFQSADLPQHLIAIGPVRAFHNRVQSPITRNYQSSKLANFVRGMSRKIKVVQTSVCVPEIVFLTGLLEMSNQNSLTAGIKSDTYRHQSEPRHYSEADMC